VAFFNNGLQIQNILTRVTGNSVSNIDGLMSANGTANLFLLNPNGISFGVNATLNLGGSFVASTASSLVFADGTVFSAKPDTSTPPLLSISVPLGLQYGTNPGKIVVQGNGQGTRLTTDLIDTDFGLRVQPNQTLALIGGDVSLEGATLKTAGGRIELGSVAGQGLVSLTPTNKGWTFAYQGVSTLGDIQMSQQAIVDASGLGSGDIQVWGRRIMLTGGSSIEASTLGEQPGGTLAANATESVEVIGTSADGQLPSALFAFVYPGASGKVGDMTINTNTLLVRDGAQVGDVTLGEGDGGNLTVNASQGVQVIGRSADGQNGSGLTVSSQRGSSGKAGNLTINTDTLLVRDGAAVSANTFGQGDGGNLTVNASNQVQVIGRSADGKNSSGLYASTEPGASGNAGNLTINTGTLLVRDGAQVGAGTFDEGDGGNLTVNASNQVQVIGRSADNQYSSGLYASAELGANGKAGNLTINTGTLLVRDGAQVSAGTFAEGDGGNLTVNASNQVQLIGRSADSQYASILGVSNQPGASGKAGDLTINTGTLLVRDGAAVSVSTFAEGDGGNLIVKAEQQVQLIGTSADGRYPSALFANAQAGASGKAGDLTINTDTLLVRDGATVTVSHPTGQAGNMTIEANSMRLNRGSLLAQTAKSSPEGGANITLKGLDLLRMDNESLISANALDQANGGNITIDSILIVATPPTGSNGSDITANAGKGNGGAVNITTQGLYGIEFRPKLTPKNDITVSSEFGVNGTFQLITPGVDPTRGLANLPTQVVDASNQIVQSCTPGKAASQQNSFVVTGSGGLPPSPDEPLSLDAVWVDWGTRPPGKEHQSSPAISPKATRTTPAPLVEAQGWVINDTGEVELTADTPTTTPHSSWHRPVTCHDS
jgi:filamentous hemagglutinin family protein